MANRTDPLNTIDTNVRSLSGVSTVIDLASLHTIGYQLPLGVPFQTVPTANGVVDSEVSSYGSNVNLSQDYLSLTTSDGEYVFPIDPIMAISGKNVITRRYVAKMKMQQGNDTVLRGGSVKESWSQDDYDITISGVLIGDDAEDLREQVQGLRAVLEAGETLKVTNELLNMGYGITHLVVESFQMPHTKGLQNQAYTIKCYSDSSINILEEVQ